MLEFHFIIYQTGWAFVKKLGIKLQPENWFCYVKDFAKTKWVKRDGLLLR